MASMLCDDANQATRSQKFLLARANKSRGRRRLDEACLLGGLVICVGFACEADVVLEQNTRKLLQGWSVAPGEREGEAGGGANKQPSRRHLARVDGPCGVALVSVVLRRPNQGGEGEVVRAVAGSAASCGGCARCI